MLADFGFLSHHAPYPSPTRSACAILLN
jgi:hypothetical protein